MKRLAAIWALAILLAATSGIAVARGGHGGGHSGGGHFSGGRVGGGTAAASSPSVGHFSGRAFTGHHFDGDHFRGGHFRSGFGAVIAGPLFPAWYDYPPPSPLYYYDYGYADPAVAVPPPEYVEQGSPPAQQPNYWYYCASSKAYYPYVNECPEAWQQVVPQAPSQ